MDEHDAGVREIAYWASPGPSRTDGTIDLALKRASDLGIDRVVVASNTGETARRVRARAPAPTSVICVTHQVGFGRPGEDEMGAAVRRELRDAGVEVFTGTHFFAGVDRALRRSHSGLYPAEVVAQTLRLLGQGVKVAVEIAVMATDAGLVPPDREVLSLGGTGRGADTALVLRPAHGQDFFSTRVVEIVCMPR
jgi:uncharacterized protein